MTKFDESGCQIHGAKQLIATGSRVGRTIRLAFISRTLCSPGSVESDTLKEIGFCELCTNGKHHQSLFQPVVQSELESCYVCGKMGEKSLSGMNIF